MYAALAFFVFCRLSYDEDNDDDDHDDDDDDEDDEALLMSESDSI